MADEVANWLGITVRGVRKMMDRGEVPWAFLGRQRVVPREMLVHQLTEHAKRNALREWRG